MTRAITATTRTPTPAAHAEVGARAPVVEGWYGHLEGVTNVNHAALETPYLRRIPVPLLRRLLDMRVTRGFMLFAISLDRPMIGLIREAPGWTPLLVLRALFGRRPKLVVFQFILHRRRHPLRKVLYAVDRWTVRRALLRGHALSRYDLGMLTEHYRVERFTYVPWPLADEPPEELPPLAEEPMALCAGRAYCDWETVFAAADGAEWPLTVVCGKQDLRRVMQLAESTDARVEVLSELPREEFLALLRRATVYVVAMHERRTSQGHIRVMDGRTQGVPLVVTVTEGLAEYVEDGRTALVTAPGDASAMRAAIERLMADRDLAERLRRNAYADALGWQVPDYFEALTSFLYGRAVSLPAGAPGQGMQTR